VAIIASDLVKNVLLDFLGKNAFEEVPVRWFAPRDFVSQTTLNAPTLYVCSSALSHDIQIGTEQQTSSVG
jgi:hypothetical protein